MYMCSHFYNQKAVISAVILLILIGVCGCSQSQVKSYDGYRLIWHDEFDSGAEPEYPNPDSWGYERGYVRNEEWQYYCDDLANAYCQNGMLNIKAIKHAPGTYPKGRHPHQDGSISSASLKTQRKAEHLYGKLEMRAKIDLRWGSWPAFWTLGAKGPWPDNGECDIMEYYAGMLKFNVAWQTPKQYIFWDSEIIYTNDLGDGWDDEFHVWAMEWEKDYVKLYLDGELINEWDSSQDDTVEGKSIEGFQQPHYIIVNQAIGGTNGGDAGGLEYPTEYVIDWIRWYQKN